MGHHQVRCVDRTTEPLDAIVLVVHHVDVGEEVVLVGDAAQGEAVDLLVCRDLEAAVLDLDVLHAHNRASVAAAVRHELLVRGAGEAFEDMCVALLAKDQHAAPQASGRGIGTFVRRGEDDRLIFRPLGVQARALAHNEHAALIKRTLVRALDGGSGCDAERISGQDEVGRVECDLSAPECAVVTGVVMGVVTGVVQVRDVFLEVVDTA